MVERWLWILAAGEDPGEEVAAAAAGDARGARRLVSAAERALRSGLAVRPVDLIALSLPERAALEEAGQRVRLEMAGLIGRAAQSHEAALAVSSPLDEGLEYDRAQLSEAHDELVDAVRTGGRR